MYYVGIDTSCYTTSMAVLDAEGELILDSRKLLLVKDGERGLRQSDGLFQHIVNLEEMVHQLTLVKEKMESVTASKKPRNEDGSYMPVFKGGSLAGSFLAMGTKAKYAEISHQEGHLYSALWSLRNEFIIEDHKEFMFFHISGGTTELLLAKNLDGINFSLERIGGTSDLNGGQFIDRVGVASGLGFPSGSEMDLLLQRYLAEMKPEAIKETDVILKMTVKGSELSFSGPETQAVRLLNSGMRRELVYKAVFEAIENALIKVIRNASKAYGVKTIIISGGVAANTFIRKGLVSRLSGDSLKENSKDNSKGNSEDKSKRKAKDNIEVFFPNIKYASDNAVGDAYYGFLVSNNRTTGEDR